ncbi:MAG TPA: SMP-30/gluconolactonase/LRE family protein, partial [Thermohalobaculum sp.]|nr:SMP-30/gluconolactonase/LRE family protein [Thermohalobaculum sp.]
MSLYPPPRQITARVWTRMPEKFRIRDRDSDWTRGNKPGPRLESFLEGPCFDRAGNLWVTDIPYGRIFRISPQGEWELAAQYDGWPNGLKIHPDGRFLIADYKHGILELDPTSGAITPIVTTRYAEHFRGCNDLTLDRAGRCLYFTDQGQSGTHMANGRVYRFDLQAGRLDLLIDTGPSPNGLVLNAAEDQLFVGMTRGNAVWRLPLMPDGGVSKAGIFIQMSGGSGPDGLTIDTDDGIIVAHVGMGSVWSFTRLGEPAWRILSPEGLTTTNVAFGGSDHRRLYITESHSGSILTADLPVPGRRLLPEG